MPERVANRGEVSPRQRVREDAPAGDGYFYPHEAVTILKLDQMNYRQLRNLFRLVRTQAGLPTPTGWARFSLLDLAAMQVAIRLAGTKPGRLELSPIAKACAALRSRGVDNPLLDTQLERHAGKVFAVLDGTLLDPVSGQEVIQTTARLTRGFLEDRLVEDAQVSVVLTAEIGRTAAAPPPVRTYI